MTTTGLDDRGLARLDEAMRMHVERGELTGLAWIVTRHGDVRAGVAGAMHTGGPSVERDTIFRIASMTKPVTAVAALQLIEDGRLRLDDPVDRWLPELADRRVLARRDGPLDDTVAATRPITVDDVLTFRLGYGMDFADATHFGPPALIGAMAALDLGIGPPAPARTPAPDEWIRRLGTLPLAHQPGERWLYHTGSEVLGVLVARVAGQPLDVVVQERIFEPLGMVDTGFCVRADALGRLTTSYSTDPASGGRAVYDPPDGQWSRPPVFPSGGGGLVSTADDYLAFAEMLLAGGAHRGRRILTERSVAAMTSNRLTAEQLAAGAPDPAGALGWGFGVGVQLRSGGSPRSVGAYGWDGGLGTSWANDPATGLIGILLTNESWTSPVPPPVCDAFWADACAAVTGAAERG